MSAELPLRLPIAVTGATGAVARGVLPLLQRDFDLTLLSLDPPHDDRHKRVDILDLPALTLGTPVTGQLPSTGTSMLYKVTVPAGTNLNVALTGPAGAANELYVSFGDVPRGKRSRPGASGWVRPTKRCRCRTRRRARTTSASTGRTFPRRRPSR